MGCDGHLTFFYKRTILFLPKKVFALFIGSNKNKAYIPNLTSLTFLPFLLLNPKADGVHSFFTLTTLFKSLFCPLLSLIFTGLALNNNGGVDVAMGNLLSLFKSNRHSPGVSRGISGGTAGSNHSVTGRTPSYDPGMVRKPNINDTSAGKAKSGTGKQLSTQKKYAYIPDNFTSLQQVSLSSLENFSLISHKN